MFQTVDEITDPQITGLCPQDRASSAKMSKIMGYLDAELNAGGSISSLGRTKTAVLTLLRCKGLSSDEAPLSLSWFDETFPYDGWNPVTMPKISQKTYRDYRKRARSAVQRCIGMMPAAMKHTAPRDGWTELADWLDRSPESISTQDQIPIRYTLTNRARELGLQPRDVTTEALRHLHETVPNPERKSVRNGSRQIHRWQNEPELKEAIREFFPQTVVPIDSPAHKLNVPDGIVREIDRMIELSSRKKFVSILGVWEYYKKGTRDNHRTILRRIASSLISTGGLSSWGTLSQALKNEEAVRIALKHIHDRACSGDLAWSTAGLTATHLPVILERNGIHLPNLRGMVGEVDRFANSRTDGMPEEIKLFCRSLIERPSMLADFGTAHLVLRGEAQKILDAARKAARTLTSRERSLVRQLGTVALFCAIETGAAPLRVENFLMMPLYGPEPWLLRRENCEFLIAVPGGYTKNGKPIRVTMLKSRFKCTETVEWFIKSVRPHYFENLSSDPEIARSELSACPYLVPAIRSKATHLNYRSFADWFSKWMRDLVGIVCTPHNFRHGQASVMYYAMPGRIDLIAERLGDCAETVIGHYAWVHSEIKARQGQELLFDIIQNSVREGTRR